MELRQIEYFLAVNKYKNYTRAASELHVSQPTISVSIQKLEEELGIRLLERDNKRIDITREGEIFLEHGQKILEEMKNLAEIMEDLKPSAKKKLKVAFPSTVGSWLWKELLFCFTKKYPDIELEILDLGTLDIVEALKKEELELGYGVIVLANDEEIDSEVIRGGELKIIVSCCHHFVSMPQIPTELLADESIIMYHKGTTYTEKLLTEKLEKAGIARRFRYVREQSTVFDMVAQNCGVAVVLDDQVSAIKDNPKIVSKEFIERSEFETGLLWNKRKYLSDSARKFQLFIENYIE